MYAVIFRLTFLYRENNAFAITVNKQKVYAACNAQTNMPFTARNYNKQTFT